MKSPRKVRGLIEIAKAEAAGEDWILDEPSAEYIPGLGLGATDEARRWAFIGYFVEKNLELTAVIKKRRGRPTVSPFQSKDAFRAFKVWTFARALEPKNRKTVSNRELIRRVAEAEKQLNIPMAERAFPEGGNFEAAVSRGRKILEIDDEWHSPLCEKIAAK